MIGLLKGTVLEVGEKECLILTQGGVGYTVYPGGSLLSQLQKGSITTVFIYTVVREQELSLYGFGTPEEKQLFAKLLAVSGIGPKTALGMVSIPVSQFLGAVEKEDVAFLSRVPGLGKKTAQRLILELKGKLNLDAESSELPPAIGEAVEALANLGYEKSRIHTVLTKAPEGSSTEDLVKFFLSQHV